MPPRYAVIPAAGSGERIKPYSEKVPKPMIQVLGRPILAYILERCKQAGISNVVIITNPQSNVIQNYFEDGSDFGLSIEYISQSKPEGIAHAVGLTDGIVKTPFAVYLGDELYFGSDHFGFINSFDKDNCSAVIGLLWVENTNIIKRNYSVDMNIETGIIQHVVEKPKVVKNKILGCGSYIFDETVYEAIHRTPKSTKNEIEITDTLNIMNSLGYTIRGYFLGGTYLNVTYPEDIAQAEELIQQSTPSAIH